MLLEAGGWSALLDKNLLRSEVFCSYEGAPADQARWRVVLNDPQTSGGLIAIVRPDIVDALVTATPEVVDIVGWVTSGEQASRSAITIATDTVDPRSTS